MAETLRARAAAEVRAEIARQQITQDGLAARLGVSQTWVSRRINGNTAFSTEDLDLVARALGVPVANFTTRRRAA
jgi:transcriptional regulator with XRE-family HTH domain